MGYNYQGKYIPSNDKKTDKELTANSAYLKKDGRFNWPEDNGFDNTCNIADQGSKVPIEFSKGKVFARYGNNIGHLIADKGIPYEFLGLPYKKELKEYHEYILKKKLKIDECGYIAPVFDSRGGVMQYYVKDGIQSLIDKKILDEDITWLEKI